MGSDRQDFLERKAARQRRSQQRAQHVPPAAETTAPQPAPASGKAGRRMAARRAQQAVVQVAAGEPKPSLLARIIVWGTMATCALLILATIGEAWTVHQLNQQVADSQQQNAQLRAQNQAIATSITQLQQPETIEQEARQLGYIYPGDQPVVVVTTQPTAPAPQKKTQPASGWWGFWPDWLKLFFGG
jgi:cell division protein FtsB